MVPDIEWGKNIRIVLHIGCTDVSFGAFLLDMDVLTLSLGLKDDLVDLAQVALERGFPAVVNPFASRRLPFPSGVFDAIHCGGCNVAWHSNGLFPLPLLSFCFFSSFSFLLFLFYYFLWLRLTCNDWQWLNISGAKLLLEMNRILRPGGYFILSSKHDNIEDEEGVTSIPPLITWLGDTWIVGFKTFTPVKGYYL